MLNLIVQSGDKVLEDHFKTAPRNATYRSKTVQNELIKCCENHILRQLINDIKEAQFFSVLADETQDNSNKEQIPIILCFVDNNSTIREEFVEFVHCKDGISGESIAGYITEALERYSLEMKNCRGQGYDGAGNMSGKYIGASSIIRRQYPLAIYIHCASHRLNLCITASCQIQIFKVMMGTVKAVSDFFYNSPKRQEPLSDTIKKVLPREKHKNYLTSAERDGL